MRYKIDVFNRHEGRKILYFQSETAARQTARSYNAKGFRCFVFEYSEHHKMYDILDYYL